MEVVLLKGVERLGREGGVVKVKPGFARNFLVPRGLAMEASAANLKRVEALKREAAVKQARARAQAETVKQTLERQTFTLSLAVGEGDVPFGSVSVNDIAAALKGAGVAVERSKVQLEQPIKTLGQFDVAVKLHHDVTATVKISVVKA